MSLLLNEEQTMLRDSARDFLSAQAPLKQLRELRDKRDPIGYSKITWQEFVKMGFTGALVPEAYGGLGLGHVEAGVIMEQCGHTLTASPLLASGIVAATAIQLAGNETQRQNWLSRIASGQAIVTLAIDEHTKHRPLDLTTSAKQDGAGWVLTGRKLFVLEAHTADLFIVAAKLEGGPSEGMSALGKSILATPGLGKLALAKPRLGLFLVERQAAGLSIERTAMVDSQNAGRLELNSVRLNAEAYLGEASQAALEAALNAGRCAAAAQLLGIADEVFERTVQYLKDRKQFGKAIGEFQALQHRAATLYTEIELTRAVLIKAQLSLDQDIHKAGEAVALAKARAGQCANLAVQEGLQMHGGMGMTDAFDIGFFMKRARVLQELWGDANYHLDQLANSGGY